MIVPQLMEMPLPGVQPVLIPMETMEGLGSTVKSLLVQELLHYLQGVKSIAAPGVVFWHICQHLEEPVCLQRLHEILDLWIVEVHEVAQRREDGEASVLLSVCHCRPSAAVDVKAPDAAHVAKCGAPTPDDLLRLRGAVEQMFHSRAQGMVRGNWC